MIKDSYLAGFSAALEKLGGKGAMPPPAWWIESYGGGIKTVAKKAAPKIKKTLDHGAYTLDYSAKTPKLYKTTEWEALKKSKETAP